MNLINTVNTEVTQDDFDMSQWASVFFSCICGVCYLIIVMEIAVVQNYLQLCEENYHWQWRSFMNGASPAFFLFILSLLVKLFGSKAGTASINDLVAQLITMLAVCATIGLMGAAVAFSAALKFN